MKYVFDSSSIFTLIKENKIEKLANNYTMDFSIYEFGNILWKEHILHKHISKLEQKELLYIIKGILSSMEILTINGYEEEVLVFANQYRITFYDATYAYHAERMKLPLITEDLKLMKSIKKEVKSFKSSEL